jgi:hypothetical protein
LAVEEIEPDCFIDQHHSSLYLLLYLKLSFDDVRDLLIGSDARLAILVLFKIYFGS